VKSEQRSFGAVLRCEQCGAVRSTLSVRDWSTYQSEHGERTATLNDPGFLPSPSVDEANFISRTGFCRACHAATTNESPGSTFTLNFVFGTRFLGWSSQCPKCESVVRWLWFWFVIPLVPLGRYRIKYLSEGLVTDRYIGRRAL